MKSYFFGNEKPVVIKSADDVQVTIRDYPLGKVVFVSRLSALSRLRATWAALMAWTPTDLQLRQLEAIAHDTSAIAGGALKIAVGLTVIYLAAEVGTAFLPGGPVERILGGVR